MTWVAGHPTHPARKYVFGLPAGVVLASPERNQSALANSCWTHDAESVRQLLAALPYPSLEGRTFGGNDTPRTVMELFEPECDRVSPVDPFALYLLVDNRTSMRAKFNRPDLRDVSILELLFVFSGSIVAQGSSSRSAS